MSFEDLPHFMTPRQLADVTDEHEGSITRGIREGRIPADKVNGRWRICRDVIFKNAKRQGAWMTEGTATSPSGTGPLADALARVPKELKEEARWVC